MLSEIHRRGLGVEPNIRKADGYLEDAAGIIVKIVERQDHYEIAYGTDAENAAKLFDNARADDPDIQKIREYVRSTGILASGKFTIRKRPGDDI